MFCFRYRRLINLERDGRLPDHRVRDLEDHLAGCAACREYREDLGLAHRLLAATGAAPSPSFEWTLQLKLNRALQEAAGAQLPLPEEPGRNAVWWRRLALSSLAGAAATVALALWLFPAGGPTPRTPAAPSRLAVTPATAPAAAASPVASTAGSGDRRSLAAPNLFSDHLGGFGRLASTPDYLGADLGRTSPSPSLLTRLLRENEVLRSQVLVLQARNRALQALLAEHPRDTVASPDEGVEEP